MTSIRGKKWICIFISICIFLSGMCFDHHKTDSFFFCADVASSSSKFHSPTLHSSYFSVSFYASEQNKYPDALKSYIQNSRQERFFKDICTSKLMGIDHAPGFSLIRFEKVRRLSMLRTFFLYFSLAGLLYFQLSWKRKPGLHGKARTYSNSYIIQYIHGQDGKKDTPTVLRNANDHRW